MNRFLFLLLFLFGGVGTANSAPVLPRLSVGSIALREGNAVRHDAVFRVALPKNAVTAVSVVVATKNGTARAGEDYVATRKTLLFAPGTRLQTFAVPIIGDTKVERDETFSITASAKGYSSLDPAAVCTIRNDDVAPQPTATPRPTSTTRPTATATPRPTSTPLPSATPQPTATSTPRPIIEPSATATPTATSTPSPTATARPTPTPKPTATPQPLSPSGKIACAISPAGSAGVYVMNADGSNRTRISNLGAFYARWSPDGNRVLFMSNGLRVVNSDGSGLVTVQSAGVIMYWGFWSPDGTKICIEGHSNLNTDSSSSSLYVVNADGSNLRLVSSTVVITGTRQWSHDSTRLLFRDLHAGGQICIYNAQEDELTGISQNSGFTGQVVWSFDDSRIIFTSSTSLSNGVTWSVCSMNPDESNRTVLADNLDGFPDIQLSPDGQKISCYLYKEQGYGFFVMNSDGSNRFDLSQYATNQYDPVWSPDSQKFALLMSGTSPHGSSLGPYRQVFTINADGTNPIRLSLDASNNDYIRWSPDGKCVGWTNYAPPTHTVIADAVGNGSINLSEVNDSHFDWTFGSVPASTAASPRPHNSSAPAS